VQPEVGQDKLFQLSNPLKSMLAFWEPLICKQLCWFLERKKVEDRGAYGVETKQKARQLDAGADFATGALPNSYRFHSVFSLYSIRFENKFGPISKKSRGTLFITGAGYSLGTLLSLNQDLTGQHDNNQALFRPRELDMGIPVHPLRRWVGRSAENEKKIS
jgi:hypothetical protein